MSIEKFLSVFLLVSVFAACSGAETQPKAELQNENPPLTTIEIYGADLTLEQAAAVAELCDFSFFLGQQTSAVREVINGELEEDRIVQKADATLQFSAQKLRDLAVTAGENSAIWTTISKIRLMAAAELLRSVPLPSGGEIVFERETSRVALTYMLSGFEGSPELNSCNKETVNLR